MYDVARLRSVIAEELGDRAAWRVNDVPADVMLTAKGLDDGHQWYFVKDRPGASPGRTGGLLARRLRHRLRGGTHVLRAVAGRTARAARRWRRRRRRQPDLPGVRRGVRVHRRLPPGGDDRRLARHRAIPRPPPADVALVMGAVGPERAPPLPGRAADRAGPAALPRRALLPDRRPAASATSRSTRAGGDIDELLAIGEALAATVDWPAILDGTDETFLVRPGETQPGGLLPHGLIARPTGRQAP